MLTVEPFETLTLMSVDPGLHNIGVCVYKVDLRTPKFLSINAFTLKSARVLDTSCLDDDSFTEQVRIRYSMLNAFEEVLRKEMPDRVVSESPFFDSRKPGSFAILSIIVEGLFDRAVKVNPNTSFSLLAPQLVKSALGVAGIKGKEVVREAMEKTDSIMSVLETPIETLDEHGVDATAVGYAYFMKKSGLFSKEN